MRNTAAIITLLAVALAPGAALSSPTDMREFGRSHGYSAQDVAKVEDVLARFAGPGNEPLISKAREGMAKRIPIAKLTRVLAELGQELGDLRKSIPAGLRTGEVLRAALAARRAGVSAKTVAELTADAAPSKDREARLTAAFYAAGLARTGGINETSTRRFVGAQLEAGLPPPTIETTTITGVRAVKSGLATQDELANATPADFRAGGYGAWTSRMRGFERGNIDKGRDRGLRERGVESQEVEKELNRRREETAEERPDRPDKGKDKVKNERD